MRPPNIRKRQNASLVLLRFVGGQVAVLVRSLGVHVAKRFEKPKPVVFDRTPKKGA